jgi:hypothetical protein
MLIEQIEENNIFKFINFISWSGSLLCKTMNYNVAHRPAAKPWLCKQVVARQRPQHTRKQQENKGVMQPISKHRICKHAYNDKGIIGHDVFY